MNTERHEMEIKDIEGASNMDMPAVRLYNDKEEASGLVDGLGRQWVVGKKGKVVVLQY